ncbi:MAG: hypothetical protein HRU12_21685 [Phaeodactylibacter sp.]|nr:hypothetical protein [Phaeodactylibacter sp.]
MDKNKIPFTTRTIFEVHRGDVVDHYELITTGTLIRVERNFPHNPHGLLITGFFEESLRKIINQN